MEPADETAGVTSGIVDGAALEPGGSTAEGSRNDAPTSSSGMGDPEPQAVVRDERAPRAEYSYGTMPRSLVSQQMSDFDGAATGGGAAGSGNMARNLEAASVGMRAGANVDAQGARSTVDPVHLQPQRDAALEMNPLLVGTEETGDRDVGSAGFMTPRSLRATGVERQYGSVAGHFQQFSRGEGEQWPRWMQRLTDMFRAPQVPATWIPSHLPSPISEVRSRHGKSDGARAAPSPDTLVQGPPMAVKPPSPPSSSSVPAEAIQAEVQRQLGGLLERLQRSEAENARLQKQLEQRDQEYRTAAAALAPREPRVSIEPRGPRVPLPSTEPSVPPVPQALEEPHIPRVLRPPNVPRASTEPEVEAGPRELQSSQYMAPAAGSARPSEHREVRRDLLGSLWGEISGRLGASRDGLAEGGAGRVGQDRATAESKKAPRVEGELAGIEGHNVMGPTMPTSSSSLPQNPPNLLDAITKSIQQLQELQVQSFRKEEDGSPEQVKSSIPALPSLKAPQGDAAGVQLQDWLSLVSTCMQDLSASSGAWWEDVVREVGVAYARWLSATPLERLQIYPHKDSVYTTGRWTRINARACTLVLASLDDAVKEDLVGRRSTQSMVALLFRLHTVYQPGGPHERAKILQVLQDPPVPETLAQCLATLRTWPRSMQRCEDMGMTHPDGSVLAKALTAVTAKFLSGSQDASFRTQLLRSTLRIDGQPSVTSVHQYQQHLQAEIENLIAAGGDHGAGNPKLRAVMPKSGAEQGDLQSPTKGKPACRYFFKTQGCRRGAKCLYGHDVGMLSKGERSKKCLVCGSEEHRQRECPTTKPQKPPKALPDGSPKSTSSTTPSTAPRAQQVTFEDQIPPEVGPPIQGDPVWTMEALLKAAAQVVQATPTSSPPEPKAPSMKVMTLKKNDTAHLDVEDVYALMDSGATHPLRRAWTDEEWWEASPVIVTLAGGESVSLRMNEGGTLLVPSTGKEGTAPIVPLGSLVQQLGYTLEWNSKKCRLVGRAGDVHHLRVRNGCPEVAECQALNLIARLEEEKLNSLKTNVANTQERVRQAAVSLNKTWFDHLIQFCRSDRATDAVQAVGEAPFFQEVPLPAKQGLTEGYPEGNGWDALRGLTHLNRRTRKRLHESERWIVHLFAGKQPREEYKYLEKNGYVLLELDIERGSSHDIMNPAVWRALEWAARRGKISGVIGGPPCRTYSLLRYKSPGPAPVRSNDYPYGGWEGQSAADESLVIKDTALYVRMIYLHALSTAGKVVANPSPEQNREVAFLLEQPRDPQEYLPWDHELHARAVSFWRSGMWHSYAQEAGLAMYSLEQGALGHQTRKPTTLGTNLVALSYLNGVKTEGDLDPWSGQSHELAAWAPELVEAIVKALIIHGKVPRMLAMSVEQWKDHVRRGHLPFRRDCLTCVQAGATGRRHSKVEHPDAFVLTADLSGPLKQHGLDSHGRGRAPKKFPYLFVAKLKIPRSFVDDGRGVGVEFELPEISREETEEPDDGLTTHHEENPTASGSGDGHEEGEMDEEEEEQPEGFIEVEQKDSSAGNRVMFEDDQTAPEMVNLIFANGLGDNKSATVLEAIQDVVHYAQAYNIPILRFHCDRSMEFFAKGSRRWIKDQGIRMTSSEGGEHQSNGTAESTVRWVKQRARTLLAGARLPQQLWPSAVQYACAQQRASVLGFETKLAAPFGSKVLIKKKSYVGAHHGGKLDDLAPRWEEGYYLGLSDTVRGGHLVYVDHEGSRFLHTLHVRPHVHDPGPPEEVMEAEPPREPRRRLREKTPGLSTITTMHQVSPLEIEDELRKEAEKVLQDWNIERAEDLVIQACALLPNVANKYGVFRHGGVMGLTRASYEYPWIAKVMVRIIQEVDPDAEFASIYLSVDGDKGLHMDSRNEAGTYNYVYPLRLPRRGGDLWIELCNGDVIAGKILELKDKAGKSHYGTALGLKESVLMSFNPRRRHAVMPWNGGPGDRITIIGYTPARVGRLTTADKDQLAYLGFSAPVDLTDDVVAMRAMRVAAPKTIIEEEVQDLCGGGWTERVRTSDGTLLFMVDWKLQRELGEQGRDLQHTNARSSSDFQPTEQDDSPGELYLVIKDDEEPQLARMTEMSLLDVQQAKVMKTEVNYTRGIEELLEALQDPIAVVHTVHPSEATEHLHRWVPAITKELGAIQHAVVRLKKGDPLREEWLSRPGVQILPMKLVYTIKPPEKEPAVKGDPLYKRKARAVICGNMADTSGLDVYTGAAPAEVVRAALTIASKFGWFAAVLDVIAAFLQTPMEEVPQAPVVVAVPPKGLVKANLAEEEELWGITHAVYGLRESPRLWGFFRDEEMRKIKAALGDKEVVLIQGRVEPTWWSIRLDGQPAGILVIYVDDYLILASREIIHVVATAVQQIWKTSPLQYASKSHPVRFLGMEIHVTASGFAISQRSYIQELLRIHSVSERRLDVVPVSRELAGFDIVEGEDEYTQQELRFAQQCAGEILWLSQRSRPDLGFAASLLSSLTTRAPRRVAEITVKVLGYLQRSQDSALYIEADDSAIVSYADSSFAPSGERSHTGWVTMLFGTPISWRSSRQPTTSLSTGEAELTAATEGALAAMSTQALLCDVLAEELAMKLETDSTTALALAEGSGSWRTRHLRIKANWLHEKIQSGLMEMVHCRGIEQPADLLTKAMPSTRMLQLMELWNIRRLEPEGEDEVPVQTAVGTRSQPSVSRVLLALMVLAQSTTPGDAHEGPDENGVAIYEPLHVDRSLATWAAFWGLIFVMIAGWELLKWLGWQAFFQIGSGASERRMRRLQRLRDATAQAINDEFARLMREPDAEPTPAVRTDERPLTSMRRRSTNDRATSPRRRGVIERSTQTVAPAFVRPDPVPQPIMIRYLQEPPEQVYAIPGRATFHIHERCYAFRHPGTMNRVERLRLCGFCQNHDGRDPRAQHEPVDEAVLPYAPRRSEESQSHGA